MSNGHFCSHGGGIHHTACIGHPPEHRDWTPTVGCLEPIIDRTARIEAFVSVDSGIDRPTYVCAKVWLMKHVHVGHDAYVGDHCELAPGVIIGGHAMLLSGVRVGIGAVVLPGVHIGRGARIGAGAVVTRNVPDGETWAGNPARNLHPRPRDEDFARRFPGKIAARA